MLLLAGFGCEISAAGVAFCGRRLWRRYCVKTTRAELLDGYSQGRDFLRSGLDSASNRTEPWLLVLYDVIHDIIVTYLLPALFRGLVRPATSTGRYSLQIRLIRRFLSEDYQ